MVDIKTIFDHVIIIIEDSNSIVALEWAQKLGEMLPSKRIDLHFEYLGNNQRKIVIKKYE